jgi:hypothetical protein
LTSYSCATAERILASNPGGAANCTFSSRRKIEAAQKWALLGLIRRSPTLIFPGSPPEARAERERDGGVVETQEGNFLHEGNCAADVRRAR